MNSLKISSALRRCRLILKTRRKALAVVAVCAMITAAIFFQQFDFTKKTAAASLRQDNPNSQDGLWVRADDGQIQLRQQQPQLQPGTFRVFRLNQDLLKEKLRTAPMESSSAAKSPAVEITLPMPDGTFGRFRIEESPIMEPALAAKFPDIKTYQGQGIDDSSAYARFDLTPDGFHALVLGQAGSVQIAPTAKAREGEYFSIFTQDSPVPRDVKFLCGVNDKNEPVQDLRQSNERNAPQFTLTSGTTLRNYRLAVATTRNFTNQYGGGTVAGAISTINTVMNQVNAIYRRELSITMTLVANNDQIVHTDSNVGPYTDSEGNTATGTTNNENQAHIDAVIMPGNYDIGHIFGAYTAGAYAGFATGNTCAGGKAKGSSMFNGGTSPSAFDILVVTHEMGHQFGAGHTFNDSCGGNRQGGTAWEPNSGSTIMSYGSNNCPGTAGLQNGADLYFHVGSLNQIASYITGGGNCSTNAASSNNPPTVNAGVDFTIPQQTPFTLIATGSDPDGDALTYTWEQYDLGAMSPPDTDDGSRPIFRSFKPNASLSRTFPSLNFILNNANVPPTTLPNGYISGESLPSTNRTLNFQVTARDNRTDGAFSTDDMKVNVTTSSGPFAVTQPNTPVSWPVGTTQTITWNVAGTTGAPVSCANVRILLSTDGGQNFTDTIIASTPNDGSESFVVPNKITTTARIKVEAVGNIFFDISDKNFTIAPSADLEVVSKSASPNPVVTGSTLTYTITVRNNGPTLANNVTVTDNLPSGAIYSTCNSTGAGICGGFGQNRTISFGTLANGATETITIKTEANCALADGALINNTASISSSDFDPNPGNNSKSAAVTAQNPPPVITCPSDFDAVATTPGSTSVTVTFADPQVQDNCPGATVVCTPPSGSSFVLGTTVVSCTATDSGGAMASCNFAVTIWDACIQDDESHNYILFNTFTGDYKVVVCGVDGFVMTGQGVVTREGCVTTLRDDTRVIGASFDRCHIAPRNSGSAVIKRWQPNISYWLNDRNILNNKPSCSP